MITKMISMIMISLIENKAFRKIRKNKTKELKNSEITIFI